MLKFFFDIDGTITDEPRKDASKGIGCCERALQKLLIFKAGLSQRKALEKIQEEKRRKVFSDPFDILPLLNTRISASELWTEVLKVQNVCLKVYPDAVSLIKHLHRQGCFLHILSNNTTMRALTKLHQCGLAGKRGTNYFKKIYGPDFTGCQKDSPEFFRKIIKGDGLNPKEMLIIGDNCISDVLIPMQCGIRKFIIVNRKQKGKVFKKNGVCYVRNLKLSIPFVELINKEISGKK